MPKHQLITREFAGLSTNDADLLIAFATHCGALAFRHGPAAPPWEDDPHTDSVEASFLDPRTGRRLELFLERGCQPEREDPIEPYEALLRSTITAWSTSDLFLRQISADQRDELHRLVEDPSLPNADVESKGAAAALVDLQRIAETAADNAERIGTQLRELAAGAEPRFDPSNHTAMSLDGMPTWSGYADAVVPKAWHEGLLIRAAWCDLVSQAAGRVAAACDAAIAELPPTVRPRRDAGTLLERIEAQVRPFAVGGLVRVPGDVDPGV